MNMNFSTILPTNVDHPSVVMFGIDSMSRSNFIRQLPKTYAQLQKMGFIDMLGHVKVAENTYPNWAAMLTGRRLEATKVKDIFLNT